MTIRAVTLKSHYIFFPSSQKEPEELNSDNEEEEEEESMFTLYSGNNEMSSAEDESESRRYTPPYEVNSTSCPTYQKEQKGSFLRIFHMKNTG